MPQLRSGSSEAALSRLVFVIHWTWFSAFAPPFIITLYCARVLFMVALYFAIHDPLALPARAVRVSTIELVPILAAKCLKRAGRITHVAFCRA